MPFPNALYVAPASGGEVTDHTLETVIGIANRAPDGKITDAEGALFLLTAAPLLHELLDWRRKAAVIRDLASTDNVVLMPGAR